MLQAHQAWIDLTTGRRTRQANAALHAAVGTPVPQLDGASPIIVVGMHRSGTSLTADILHRMGIFMGRGRVPATNEAAYFRDENDLLLRLGSAAWDAPERFLELIEQPQWRDAFAVLAANHLDTRRARRFWSSRGNSASWSTSTWGWKDPRNSITLPVWLQVFPDARIVHVERDVDDVVRSLQTRSERVHGDGYGVPLRTLDAAGARALHDEYVAALGTHLADVAPQRRHHLRYEDLLTAPRDTIEALAAFCAVDASAHIDSIVATVDVDRPTRR